MHPNLENSHFVHVQDVACTKYLLCRARAQKENRDTTASIVRVGHAFVLVPPYDFFLTFRLNTSNSSDALNRYVIISDRWDVVRVFEHPIVQVESSGIVSHKMLYMNTRWMNS